MKKTLLAIVLSCGAHVPSALPPPPAGEESFEGRTPRAIDEARAKDIDAFATSALARLHVPGAAIAIVRDGRVIYERAFGVRALGAHDAVTPSTLFMIGSVTKPMTTLMIGSLVDSGALAWDTPVTKALPTFAIADADWTGRAVLWQMFCHCSGLPRTDLQEIFEYQGITAEARVASMKKLKPTAAIGEKYQYSNLAVAAGGYAAAHVFDSSRSLGEAYDAAMRKKIFDPIGMRSTTLDFAIVDRADHAMPHAADIDGVVHELPLDIEQDVFSIAPAGGVWSNVRDMERWVMTELAKGVTPEGTRVVSEANVAERWKTRLKVTDDFSVGLGWSSSTISGLQRLGHDGGSFGFAARVLLLPTKHIGLVVLTNVRNGEPKEPLPFAEAVQRKVLEVLFDGKDLARTELEDLARSKEEHERKAREGIERDPDKKWLATLAGTYANDVLGQVKITTDAKLDAGEWKTSFARKVADGKTKLVIIGPPFGGGEITLGADGTLIAEDNGTYIFRRAP